MFQLAPAVAAPWWLVGAVTVAGAVLGWFLGRTLATTGYRLDHEEGRPAPLPALLVPVVLAALWGVLAWRLGGLAQGAALPAYLLLSWAGVALLWIDLDVHRLPEGLTLPLFPALAVLLVAASAARGDWDAMKRAAVAGLVVGAVYFVLFWLAVVLLPGGLGFGDVTLGAVTALALGWLGWGHVVAGFVLTYLVAGALTLVLLVLRLISLKSHVAFGPFIVVGTLLATVVTFGLV